jgi:bifunctional UDP-N-acetylglucosamine pyrophosphorylase/glucosamine-1-phosphate N-acetyltransferase
MMKALVLAAGEGTRMRPLTASTPKPLLLTAGKPFLEHTLEALKGAGIEDVFVLSGWMEDRLRERFRDGSGVGIRIRYLEQKERRGTAHAVGMAGGELDEDFLCVNGDIVVTAETVRQLLAFRQTHGQNVMTLVEVPNPREFGVVVVDKDGAVQGIEEKPERPSGNLINAGLYVFTPEIFRAIARTPPSSRGEYEITDTLRMLAAEKKVSAFVSGAPWVDVGRPWDLLRANELLLKGQKPEIRGEVEPMATIKGPVSVGEGTVVRNGSYIVGPVSIGRGCEIGPNCYIRASTTIGDSCKIGAGVEVKNSIVMNRTHVPHLNYVGDSIIGENCNLGAGTKIANLRLDERPVRASLRGERVDTGQRKLGVIMGDNVKTGINCSIDVGTVIGENSFIGPGAAVRGFVEPFSWIL